MGYFRLGVPSACQTADRDDTRLGIERVLSSNQLTREFNSLLVYRDMSER